MDYEKKYNEALERAKQKIEAGLLTEDDLSYIFPELRESGDERINKVCHKTRKRLEEWSKTPEGRESYEKVAEEMRKQIVPNDLEEAAEEYFQKVQAEFLRTLEHPTAKDCFIAGAKWDRKQMSKEAVEGVVYGNVYEHWVETGIDEKLSYLNPGDKVRVIIIKD